MEHPKSLTEALQALSDGCLANLINKALDEQRRRAWKLMEKVKEGRKQDVLLISVDEG